MEREHIATLLEKYWQGETSIEEENLLKKYFTRPDVPEEWKQEAAFFRYLQVQKEDVAIEDEEILRMLDKEPQQNDRHIEFYVKNIARVAAAILIIAVAAFFIREDYESRKEQMDPVLTDTFEDPQKAFEETKKALMLVGRQFKKGQQHAAKLGAFDDATEKVENLEREL